MDKYTFDVEDDELLVILEVHGNLQIKGEDAAQVTVKGGSAEDIQVDQQGDQITVRCESDCSVRVPTQARLRLDQAHGDVTIKAVEGEIEIKEAHGNVTLRRVGPLTIGTVHGNCEARGVYGSFEAQKIEGNLSVKDLQGELQTGRIQGNLSVENVEDGVEARVEGNAVVRLDPAPGQEYHFHVDGNIAWNMPEDASVEITIESAGRIITNLPEVEAKPWRAPCTITVGEGDAVVTLKADGNIVLSPQGPRLDIGDLPEVDFSREMDDAGREIADQITQQIEVQMAMLEQQLDAHLSNLSATLNASGLNPEQLERIQAKAREASERANERAQERMRRAQERLERKLTAVQQRAEQRARQAEHRARHIEERARRVEERLQKRSWGFTWPEAPRPPVPPVPPMPRAPGVPLAPTPPAGDPVSDEERLTILRMLQAKKITLEQAESLLAALEGKE
jgi:hypothetical protein